MIGWLERARHELSTAYNQQLLKQVQLGSLGGLVKVSDRPPEKVREKMCTFKQANKVSP